MRLSTDLLREYVAFSKNLNFAATAKALHMSSSTLNRHINDLEKEIGRKLFIRGNAIALTPTGRKLLEVATNMLLQEEEFLDYLNRQSTGLDATLRVQLYDSFSELTNFYSQVIVNLSKQYPDMLVRFTPTPDDSETLSALANGDIDFGFLYKIGKKDQRLEINDERYGSVQLMSLQRPWAVYTESSHPLAGKIRSIKDIEGQRIITPLTYRPIRKEVENLCLAHDIKPHFDYRDVAKYLDCCLHPFKGGVLFAMTDSGDSNTISPKVAIRDDLVVHRLEEDPWIHIHLVYMRDSLSEAMVKFIEVFMSCDEARCAS